MVSSTHPVHSPPSPRGFPPVYQDEKKREFVRCPRCGRIFVGRIPAGGDGSLLVPYHHRCRVEPNLRDIAILGGEPSL